MIQAQSLEQTKFVTGGILSGSWNRSSTATCCKKPVLLCYTCCIMLHKMHMTNCTALSTSHTYISIHDRSSFYIILIKSYLFLIAVLRKPDTLFRAKLPLNSIRSLHHMTRIKLYQRLCKNRFFSITENSEYTRRNQIVYRLVGCDPQSNHSQPKVRHKPDRSSSAFHRG